MNYHLPTENDVDQLKHEIQHLTREVEQLKEAMQEAVRDFHGKAVLWKAGFPHLRFSSRFLELAGKEGE